MKPELVFFGLKVPTYFLILSIVFSFIVFALVKRAKTLALNPNKALDLYLYVLFGSFIGARLFYIFYQEFSYFIENPLEIFSFWKGGFVFYGGFIGGTLAIVLYTRIKGESLRLWLNFCAPLLALGYGLGRLACFFNGCCYGEVTDVFWSVYMHEAQRHPTQIYAVLWELSLFSFLLIYEKIKGFNNKPDLFSCWLVGHGFGRLLMEHYRADDRGELLFGFSISTLISLVLILVGLAFAFKRTSKQVSPHA
jgi:phosphatidylglycerol:prolipoprotein diacylglycerol transferase